MSIPMSGFSCFSLTGKEKAFSGVWNALPNHVYVHALMIVGVVMLELLASHLREKFQ